MRLTRTPYLLLLLFLIQCFKGNAQGGLCPSNLDFELGDFTGWECRAGLTSDNPLPLTGPISGRHTIITSATAGTDPFGRFPTLCPNGSGASVKLGNHSTGRGMESISYTYTIPATVTNFSMLFYYAVVIESPGHNPAEQPRFRARIIDVSTGTPVPCVNFDFIAGNTPGGFQTSPFSGNQGSVVLYKDWTPVSINLNPYIGRTIMLEFITNDCTLGGHAGYAYVDVYTACNGAILGNTICGAQTSVTLTAPFGYQNYEWYSDVTYGTLLSNNQTLTLNPAPPVGSVLPVIVEPFPGFGCRDTLFATITASPNPPSVAGPDISTCINQPVQVGGPPTVGFNYSWTPINLVNNPIISNPFAWNDTPTPLEYVVKTTDLLTGCFAFDTTVITTYTIDTAMQLTGKTVYCTGDPNPGSLSVNPTVGAVQWYDGNNPIPGATGLTYQPTTSGSYWAQVQQLGCLDSTRTEMFTVNLTPVSVAGPDASICTNQPLQIGTIPNPAYTYAWTPAAQVSDPAIANPFATVLVNTPIEFIVHTVDPITGCNSYDTIIITGRPVDTLISLTGKDIYCDGDPAAGTLFVSNTVTAIQWYDGNTAIPGATGISYQPLVTGTYWAELQQSGCTDSTRQIPFTVHELPLVSFTASSDTACITSNTFTFTNGSSVNDGSTLSYLWKFGDGNTQTVTDPVKSFLLAGNYNVRLVTTTSNGCVDSAAFTVHVLPNGIPRFSWDSICTDRQINFYNLSDEKGSVQVNYSWSFGNGGPGSVVKNPPPVMYTTPGKTDVTLKLVTLGCEQDTMTLVRTVQVNKQADGIRYRTITVPQGSSQYLHVRGNIGTNYNWKPKQQLTSYYTQYTEFLATTNDIEYLVDITDVHTCITTDTVLMQILRKPGYYLPSAFTPNGDGKNDVVRPYLVGMKSLKSFSVFNRWGNLVFYTNTAGQGWDGKYKGVEQDPGLYIWILEYITSDDKNVTEKGSITIIR
ncbi:MAG: PKD domain-containing protein [Chitinophagaceae bacterium]